jgi:hypothetical protein
MKVKLKIFFSKILKGIEVFHKNNFIYNIIHPNNLLLNNDGSIVFHFFEKESKYFWSSSQPLFFEDKFQLGCLLSDIISSKPSQEFSSLVRQLLSQNHTYSVQNLLHHPFFSLNEKKEVPREETPKKEISKEEIPKEVIPKTEISKEKTPEKEKAKIKISKIKISKEEIPKEKIANKEISKEKTSKEEIPKEKTPDKEIPKEKTSKNQISKEEISNLIFDPEHPDHSLSRLVIQFEGKSLPFQQIPQEFFDYFGVAAMARTVEHFIPIPPQFNDQYVEKFIDNESFPDMNSFVQKVSSLDSDIEKLYAIYYCSCNNFFYDDQLDLLNYTTVEKIFQTRKVGFNDLALFIFQVAKLAKCQIPIFLFRSHCKDHNWVDLSPPEKPSWNFTSLYITIHDNNFLIEPTENASKMIFEDEINQYNKDRFLVPFLQAILGHYPIDQESGRFLQIPISFEKFRKVRNFKVRIQLPLQNNIHFPFLFVKGMF